MAPGLSVALDTVVNAVDVGSVLAEDIGGVVEDIVMGIKGVGVAAEEPCEDETLSAMLLAVRLT